MVLRDAQDADTGELKQQVEQIYGDTRHAIYFYLLCLGVSEPEAQELTQEVFLRLYQTMQKGELIQNLRGWIFRVAHNLGLKARAHDRSFGLPNPDWERLASSAQSTEHTLIQREKMARLSTALESLSSQQRNCLYLRAEGLRYREIAEVMKIKSSTVGEFLTRATRRLAEALNE